MHQSAESLCKALTELAEAIRNASSEKRTFNEVLGWNAAALDRQDLANVADDLAERIKAAPSLQGDISEDRANYLLTLAEQINRLKSTTVPMLFNGGNGVQAVPVVLDTLSGAWLLTVGITSPDWERMSDPELMPRALAQRIRGIDAHIKQIEPDVEKLRETIDLIRDARATAHSLPTDLASLQEASRAVGKLKESAVADQKATETSRQEGTIAKTALLAMVTEGEALVKQLQTLHRIGTSTTLAGAFEARARSLSNSVIGWAAVLVSALVSGVWIGSYRVADINAAMAASTVNWDGVWVNVVLTALGVAAPVWLGWIATKQIVQRFRLAEDYAYKASISNAYEGYRREAVDLDADFRDRLFGSALTRLEELPGRLVEQTTHGSPFHELISSPLVERAAKAVPGFGKDVLDMAKRALESMDAATKPSPAAPDAPADPKDKT